MDSLLFLQHRAGNRKLRNRGVLVSSQAGCLCFWSITGETHTYGEWERERDIEVGWMQRVSFRRSKKLKDLNLK